MEDQKLLWIIFSVVLFAVVVLASALYFLKPKAAEPVLATPGTIQPSGFDTYEYVRGTSPTLPMERARPGGESLEIVVGEEPQPAAAAPKAAAPASPQPASPAPERPQPARAPLAAPPKAAPRPTPPPQPARVYWIQAASFKNRTGADEMVATLAEKGITGRVQVSDVGGSPYFRVRVGPYPSRQEAEKFLSWVKGVKGLEQSYISAVSRSSE